MEKESCGGHTNTDREIWRKRKDDYYSPSIFITKQNGMGINVGGEVIVKPVEKWFKLAQEEINLIKQIEELERSEKMWKKINIIKKSDIRDFNNRNIKLKADNRLIKVKRKPILRQQSLYPTGLIAETRDLNRKVGNRN